VTVSVGFVTFVNEVTTFTPFVSLVFACSSPIEPFSPGAAPGQRSIVFVAGPSAVRPMVARQATNRTPRLIAVCFIAINTPKNEGNQTSTASVLSLPARATSPRSSLNLPVPGSPTFTV
jgi:hypothetical protein